MIQHLFFDLVKVLYQSAPGTRLIYSIQIRRVRIDPFCSATQVFRDIERDTWNGGTTNYALPLTGLKILGSTGMLHTLQG